MSHILDDFIFVGPAGSNECRLALKKFLAVSEHLNIPIKHSKTVLPTTLATVHGIEIDTVQMIARLPQEKLQFCLVNYIVCVIEREFKYRSFNRF